MVFCNKNTNKDLKSDEKVTILILIDGFLQWRYRCVMYGKVKSHNPYFNRWFSAIHYSSIIKSILQESQSLF